jgi:hypothetical protein
MWAIFGKIVVSFLELFRNRDFANFIEKEILIGIFGIYLRTLFLHLFIFIDILHFITLQIFLSVLTDYGFI